MTIKEFKKELDRFPDNCEIYFTTFADGCDDDTYADYSYSPGDGTLVVKHYS